MPSEQLPSGFPPQHQERQPGFEYVMKPLPISDNSSYQGSGKLRGKVALITGGDSGIGRAVAIAFAKEGAKVAIAYYDEHRDAGDTMQMVQKYGGQCLLLSGDLRNPSFCKQIVEDTVQMFGSIDILVNNAGVQFVQTRLEDISQEQLETTFRINIFSYIYVTQAALPHMKKGNTIINTASIVAYQGHKEMVDYSASKGAVVSFTRALSNQIIDRGIRVNAVAPGPIWTPLIPASFSAEEVTTFGSNTPMKRAGQPFELAPAYVYLASDDSSYMSGQTLHVNGGVIVNG
ncbi:SDR family oxidoreductase [Microbacteriaceae bacterium 4G12]